MHKPVLIILLLFWCYATFGVQPAAKHLKPQVPLILHTDTEKVTLHSFDKAAIKRYALDKDFQYDDAKLAEASYWTRFWNWFWGMISRIFEGHFGGHILPKIILYILVIAAVILLVYVILKMVGIDVVQVFGGRSKKIDIPYTESLENIHEINFDDEVERAINSRNYRLAIRLLYLRSLKQLSDAQLIHWKLEKTNAAYINELTNDELRRSFALLTRQFEYAWYGDFFIDVNSFQNISTLFQDFKRLLT